MNFRESSLLFEVPLGKIHRVALPKHNLEPFWLVTTQIIHVCLAIFGTLLTDILFLHIPYKRLYQHRPQVAPASFCVLSMQRKGQRRTMAPAMASSHGTPQWHLTTAPSNGTTSSLSKCHNHSPPIASSNGTQQWHLTT